MTLIIGQSVDPNAGLSSRSDFFAMATAGLDPAKRKFYLLDMHKGRYDTTLQPHVVTEQYHKWMDAPGTLFYRVGVETIFYQADLFRHLRDDRTVPLLEIPRRSGTGSTSLSKYFRILGLAGRIERGDVILPGHFNGTDWVADYGTHPWLEDFEREGLTLNWVDGKEQHAHDDQWDALAMVVEMLSRFLHSMYNPEPQYASFSIT